MPPHLSIGMNPAYRSLPTRKTAWTRSKEGLCHLLWILFQQMFQTPPKHVLLYSMQPQVIKTTHINQYHENQWLRKALKTQLEIYLTIGSPIKNHQLCSLSLEKPQDLICCRKKSDIPLEEVDVIDRGHILEITRNNSDLVLKV